MGAWRKTMEPKKPGNSTGSGPESRQNVSGAESEDGQRRMRCEVSAGAAGRILDSANPKEKNLTEDCVRCSVDEREHSEHEEGAQVPRWKSMEPVRQRI